VAQSLRGQVPISPPVNPDGESSPKSRAGGQPTRPRTRNPRKDTRAGTGEERGRPSTPCLIQRHARGLGSAGETGENVGWSLLECCQRGTAACVAHPVELVELEDADVVVAGSDE